MRTFKHIHSSGRYDRPVSSVKHAFNRYVEHADLITMTEFADAPHRKAAKEAAGQKWHLVYRPHNNAHNDCAFMYDKQRFELIDAEVHKTTTDTYFQVGGHRTRPQYALYGVLRDKLNNKKFVVVVNHLPPSVERPLAKHGSTRRVVAWLSGFHGSKSYANKLRKKHKACAVLYIADYNLNFKKRWVRLFIKARSPMYSTTWKNLKFKGGTLGRRVIDSTLIRGKMKVKGSAKLFEDDNSSDHRPYIETLTYKK